MLPAKEDINTEFKQSFTDDVIIALTAFANAKGGKVYVGMCDDGSVCGIAIGKETVQKWLNDIKQKTEPSIIPDVEIIENQQKKIAVLSVQEYPVKPVAMKGRFYKRYNNSNHLLSAAEISDLILQTRNISWDSYPAAKVTLNDLSEDSIQKFLNRVKESGRFSLEGRDWKENLRKIRLLDGDTPTNAAYLLFGKGNIGYNVHIGRFKTASTIIDDKMLNCNLFEVVEQTIKFITSWLKVAFEITGETTQRTEIFEYPRTAIRELVLNTVIHRDYMSPMDVQIKIFDQKITFFSPGELYGNQTIAALKTDDYQAYTRNKLIAEAFYLTADIEKYGTGFTRIRKAIAEYPTMKFTFEEMPKAFLVSLSYDKQLQNIKTAVNVTENDPENDPEKNLNNRQKMILEIAEKNPKISRDLLSKELNVSDATIKRDITLLSSKGLLVRIGPDKGGHWEVLK